MTAFSKNWLELREPLDRKSRSNELIKTLSLMLPDRPIHVIDLGTGTGSNLRYLCKELKGNQIWQLIDNDENLLKTIPAYTKKWAIKNKLLVKELGNEFLIKGENIECHAYIQQKNLSDLTDIKIPEKALVSCSALLDLVSKNWIKTLAKKCMRIKATILFTLNYDGYIKFKPCEEDDKLVRSLINKHQLKNKGFGNAMGPKAGNMAVQVFSEIGYNIRSQYSNWKIKSNDNELQTMLLDMWLDAAIETSPEQKNRLKNWRKKRQYHVISKNSELEIGHTDILGWISK